MIIRLGDMTVTFEIKDGEVLAELLDHSGTHMEGNFLTPEELRRMAEFFSFANQVLS